MSPANIVKVSVAALRALGKFEMPGDAASVEVKCTYDALWRLSPDCRRILLLHLIDGKDFSTIASIMGWKELAVITAYHAAFHRFIVALREIKKGKKWNSQKPSVGCTSTEKIEKPSIPVELLMGPLTMEKALRLLQLKPSDCHSARRKAYIRTIRQFHPDTVFFKSATVRQQAEVVSKRINLAWEMVGGAMEVV